MVSKSNDVFLVTIEELLALFLNILNNANASCTEDSLA
jgi:hypothetical protein